MMKGRLPGEAAFFMTSSELPEEAAAHSSYPALHNHTTSLNRSGCSLVRQSRRYAMIGQLFLQHFQKLFRGTGKNLILLPGDGKTDLQLGS